MNNLSKFMIRQQNLKVLRIMHLAETLNYTTENQGNNYVKVIKKNNPGKLSDNTLSDFFNSLGRSAN